MELWTTNSGEQKLPHDLHPTDIVRVRTRADLRENPDFAGTVGEADEFYWFDDGDDGDIMDYCLESEYQEASRQERAA